MDTSAKCPYTGAKLADEGKSGTAEFEKLRTKLDELNDAQDKVNFQAGQFDDQLAALNASDIFDSNGNLVLDHDIEIVALASQSVETLKVTHGNYFKRTPEDLQPTVR